MLKSLALSGALALTMCFALAPQQAQAQDPCGGLNLGYGFGVGLTSNYIGQTRLLAPHDRPPHFALYPPVYYSDVLIPRPYGISPFAAPPGIRPVEMDVIVAPEPVTVQNPYFNPDAETAKPLETANHLEAKQTSSAKTGEVQFVTNPFFVDHNWASVER
jgi:hypothetical protein